ncbi:hypothetical protein J2Z83_002265 [Virgibacillus natechei]|uniref:MerR family transcriptional regulator n=1 Tax=Virgibacillus natechei TaxID=1216297 RepID=A0ABS4IJH2_9BACI|nr:hypothetical protein [Virgibacillus natechei]MBP1970149.1 hypothetical protein [Virgibacillus natechei]UZD14220.1 hypothetical protein OLD84_06815 [Virgibacillus natechei]
MGEIVRNCRLCKMRMESGPFTMCATCLVENERVTSFINKKPHVSIEEIARSTHVPHKKIEKMIDLGLNRKNKNITNA